MPVYNTSPFQKRVFAEKWDGCLLNYALFRIDQNLVRAQLENRWQQLVAAHDILKTTFEYNEGFKHPFQSVDVEKTVPISFIDYTETDEAAIIAQYKKQRLQNNNGIHLAVFIESDKVKYIGVSAPVTLLDNWSVNYIIYSLTEADAVTETPLQYTQYTDWLESILEEAPSIPPELANLWTVTKKPGNITLKTGTTTPGQEEYASVSIPLAPNILQNTATALQVKQPDILWMAWRFLLSKYYLGQHWSTSWISSGRQPDEFRQILGPFSKSIPFNVYDDEAKTESLKNWTENIELIETYRDYFVWGTNILTMPYTPTAFEYLDHDLFPSTWLKNNIIQIDAVYCSEPFALKLVITGQQHSLKASLQYDSNAFKPDAILAIVSQFGQLITEIAGQQSIANLSSMSLADAASKTNLLQNISQGPIVDIPFTPLPDLLYNISQQIPHHAALRFNNQNISYQALYNTARQMANTLITEFAIKPGDIVAIHLPRSEKLIQVIWAVMLSGAAYIPIDMQYPQSRIDYVLKSSNAQLLITHSANEVWNEGIKAITAEALIQKPANTDKLPDLPKWEPDQIAYIIYTSGTTGNPKGCKITMSNVLHYLKWAQSCYFSSGEAGNFPLFTSIAFDLTITSVFSTLTRGATLYITPEDELITVHLQKIFDGDTGCDTIKLTPSHIRLLQHITLSACNISTCIVGGEALLPHDVDILRSINPAMRIFNEYGPTECTVGCMIWEVPQKADTILIGKPIDNTGIYILNEQGELCPAGIAGELYVGGKTVGAGYLNNAALTAKKFIQSPFNAAEILYKTGDLGYWMADGNVNYIGRNDDMVKIRGYRIEMEEISSILRSSPLVQDTYVGSFTADDNSQQLIAYYIPSNSYNDNSNSLSALLQQHLPPYMVPAHILPVEQFILTVNGKLNKDLLPTPAEVNKKRNQAFIAPQSAGEKLMAEIWQQVLHRTEISVNDHFLSIGGDSIKAIQVVARLRAHDLQVSVRDILLYPTIAELVLHLDKNTIDNNNSLVNGGIIPLTPIQVKFFKDCKNDRAHYNQSILLGSVNRVDEEKLRYCATRLWQHHHMLRARYDTSGAELVQQILPAHTIADYFMIINGDGIIDKDQNNWIAEQTTYWQKNFDLEAGPLFKCLLLRLPHHDLVFLLAHHLIVDGISWRILLDDLTRLYQEEQVVLSPSASFGQWSEQLQQIAKNGFAEEETEYWQNIEQALNKKSPFNNRFTEQVHQHYQYKNILISAHDTDQLLQIGSSHTSMQEVLLAALAKALYLWNSNTQNAIYLESHGRGIMENTEAYASTIGWFTTKYPFLLNYHTSATVQQMLTTVKASLNVVPRNGAGYLVDKYSGATSVLKIDAEPQFSFNYLGQLDMPRDQDFFIHPLSEQQQNIGGSIYIPSTILFTLIITNGTLQIGVSYHKYLYEDHEIAGLQQSYIDCLRDIIKNFSPENSDQNIGNHFDYKGLDQEELKDIINLI